MNQSQAQTIVAGTVMGVLVIGMADDYLVKDTQPTFKFFAAVAVTGAMLAYISDVSPEAAAWLAIIIFIVVLLEEGAPVLKELQNNENIGKVKPAGSQHGSEFPVIPFTKEKGKKKPTLLRPKNVPVLDPLLVPALAPKRKPTREPVRVNLRRFPAPFFSPKAIPGNSKEAEVDLPSGEHIRIPWKDLATGAASGIGAAAIAKGVVEFLGAAADEVLRPVG